MKKTVLLTVAALMLVGSFAAIADPPDSTPPGGACNAFCASFGGAFDSVGACLGACAPLMNPGNADATGFCKAIIAINDLPKNLRGDCISSFHSSN